ncbi:MAG: hypothetical protein RDV48_13360 [Candidatus Eremiobacteraeota bacterium]|nr:hypothetical protein [Candidatus Eremiobacteraeota bacterium]
MSKSFSLHSCFLAFLVIAITLEAYPCLGAGPGRQFITADTVEKTAAALIKTHGDKEAALVRKGVTQAASLWTGEDGDQNAFKAFCTRHFASDPKVRNLMFSRSESHYDSMNGHLQELSRELSEPLQLEVGPMVPLDYLYGEFSPWAHLQDDYFKTGIAFSALLNYPLCTLEEMLEKGPKWSRREWAEARHVQRFDSRVPAEINQKSTVAYLNAENYISSYNIHMYHLLNPEGKRLFPHGLKLITHWGLRDELKGQYRNADGLARQELIVKVMERIITQQIPGEVIGSADLDWDPFSNKVYREGKEVAATSEANVRYRHLKNIFDVACLSDPYFPAHPTLISRNFEQGMEIPEKTVEEYLVAMLSDPSVRECARFIEKRLGRKLRPFDIWYDGFRSTVSISEGELDKVVKKRYPTVEAFQKDLPEILKKLGFSDEKARFLSEHIVVDPSRGAGHAMGAGGRDFKAHLRTRFGPDGMNYKGFNIAIHELGHCVEQVFSLNLMDYTLLSGVPNTAFTEAFAFMFQARDIELLGLEEKGENSEELHALDCLWDTYELSGVSLLCMRVWHWMYDHPGATPEELKEAVITLSKDVWNRYYAPVIGEKDCILLAVYSHMIESGLYLPNYPVGHLIEYQMENHMKTRSIAGEMERMCRLGRVTPDYWMKCAVGGPVSPEPLLSDARAALKKFGGRAGEGQNLKVAQ